MPWKRMSVCVAAVALGFLAATSFCTSQTAAQPQPPAKPRKQTVIGSYYAVDPRFEHAMQERIDQARRDLRAQRKAGRATAYLSVPISSRGGGWERTNLEISAFTKQRLEARSGGTIWYLNPGEYQIVQVDGKEPDGGEFLWMWTEILAGEDGLGKDFDMVYFLGPTDVAAFFANYQRPGERLTDGIQHYVERQTSEEFKRAILNDPERLLAFRRFYHLRASVAWSKGAHDEWNIFVRINKKRGVGEQIPMLFDGRALSPAEMETEIERGYELKP